MKLSVQGEDDEDEDGEDGGPRETLETAITSLDELDVPWMLEHAKQMTRMLPGGVDVIGVRK